MFVLVTDLSACAVYKYIKVVIKFLKFDRLINQLLINGYFISFFTKNICTTCTIHILNYNYFESLLVTALVIMLECP